MGELAVLHAGVAAPFDSVVGRQLAGALRLQEHDGLAQRVLVVERHGGAGGGLDGAGDHHQQRRQDRQRHGADAAARRSALVLHAAAKRAWENVEVGSGGGWPRREGEGEGKKLKGGDRMRLRLGGGKKEGCKVFGPEWLRFQAGQGEVLLWSFRFSCLSLHVLDGESNRVLLTFPFPRHLKSHSSSLSRRRYGFSSSNVIGFLTTQHVKTHQKFDGMQLGPERNYLQQ